MWDCVLAELEIERCMVVFNNDVSYPQRVIDAFQREHNDQLDTVSRAQPNVHLITPSRKTSHWLRPQEGYMKIICLASWDEQARTGGIRVIARDCEGRLGKGPNPRIRHHVLETLETVAILEGLKFTSKCWLVLTVGGVGDRDQANRGANI